jgi:predicted ArsR family transcriptional regulator
MPPSQAAAPPTTRQQDVLDALRRLQPATTDDLAAYHPLGMDAQGVRNHLSNLCRAGYVRLAPGGTRKIRKYELTGAAPGGVR